MKPVAMIFSGATPDKRHARTKALKKIGGILTVSEA
jgi:hypothetical protein